MKIKYVFCNEEVEIEVSEEWGAIILDMDREERNNNQTETRRHCSLDALNLDDAYLPSGEDLEADLLEKDRIVKAMVFPVVMYGCESWTVKEAEH